MITTGRLAERERLPTLRRLAAYLGPGTGVGRAYRELEVASLAGAHRPDPAELAAPARRFAREMRALGADDAQVVAAVREALHGGRRCAAWPRTVHSATLSSALPRRSPSYWLAVGSESVVRPRDPCARPADPHRRPRTSRDQNLEPPA